MRLIIRKARDVATNTAKAREFLIAETSAKEGAACESASSDPRKLQMVTF